MQYVPARLCDITFTNIAQQVPQLPEDFQVYRRDHCALGIPESKMRPERSEYVRADCGRCHWRTDPDCRLQ